MRPYSFLPALLLVLAAPPLAAEPIVVFEEVPSNGQLFARDQGGTGFVAARGRVTEEGFERIILRGYQNETLYFELDLPLQYGPEGAPFEARSELIAGHHVYRFELLLAARGEETWVGQRVQVLCGDAYLVQGQSNAVAADAHNEGLANDAQRRWIRSYGSASLSPPAVRDDTRWYLAEGLDANGSGTIGAWALRMAQELVDRGGVPVAILNGAVGGTWIGWHQRDDDDPERLSTNYGRLLYRARRAGLADAARALIWYQGESNQGRNPQTYRESFHALYEDWIEDFPALEKVYVVQIRSGCGFSPAEGLPIREVHRRLPETLPKVALQTATALPCHDGCHFYYDGYATLGKRMAALLARDLYGAALQDVEPLDPRTITWAAPNQVRIEFDPSVRSVHWDEGAENDFWTDSGAEVVGGRAEGATLLLELDGPAETLSYGGHSRDGPWVSNSRGVGMLAFGDLPVMP